MVQYVDLRKCYAHKVIIMRTTLVKSIDVALQLPVAHPSLRDVSHGNLCQILYHTLEIKYIFYIVGSLWGTRQRRKLRRSAISRKVVGMIPDFFFFNLTNLCSCTMFLGFTLSIRNLTGVKGRPERA
jgi:hypothetical protein